MLKKVSLSAMVFTYLFAGTAHFVKFKYFLSIAPTFLPHPYAYAMVCLTGFFEILFGLFLMMPLTRSGACYGILLLWSMALPVNIYVFSTGGTSVPLPYWQMAGMIPFHLFLILWAYWHLRPEKRRGEQNVPFRAAPEN